MKLGEMLGTWCYTKKDGSMKYYRVAPIEHTDLLGITWGTNLDDLYTSTEIVKVGHEEAYRRTLSKAMGGYVFFVGMDRDYWTPICLTEVESIAAQVKKANEARELRKPRQKKITLLDWLSGADIPDTQNNLAETENNS